MRCRKKNYRVDDLEHKIEVLPWQQQGLSYAGRGYTKNKIPSWYKVRLPGCNRWRRVYRREDSTCYVEDGKDQIEIK